MIHDTSYEAIVVGAGPAGSSAAAVLGQVGKRVLMLDKSGFPRDKTCGDGVTFKCLEPLHRLGVLGEFLDHVSFATRGYSLFFSDHTELTVRRTYEGEGSIVYVLPRYVFDHILLQAARRYPSVELHHHTKVESLIWEEDRVGGVTAVQHGACVTWRSPLVIDASGANTTLAVEAGLGNQDPKQCALALRGYYDNVEGLSDTIELYFDPRILPEYFWIFPTGPRSANIGCGTFQHLIESQRIDLRQLMQDFFTHHPVAKGKLGRATLSGTLKGGKIPLAIDHNSSRVRSGFMMAGDAASFTDPITAEGISYAMRSGILAAEAGIAALEAHDISATGLSIYDQQWQAAFNGQFAKAPVLTTRLPPDIFTHHIQKAFDKSSGVQAAFGNLGLQYELMVKVKAMMKAL